MYSIENLENLREKVRKEKIRVIKERYLLVFATSELVGGKFIVEYGGRKRHRHPQIFIKKTNLGENLYIPIGQLSPFNRLFD